MKKSYVSPDTIVLLFFILLKFVLQYLLINSSYDLQRDEYLHLDQANHLAAGYVSVPPVTAFISLLIKALGNTFFWIKFFPALFGALTIVVVWYIIKEIQGRLFAQILAATAITFSAILRVNILYQPNSLDILGYTLIYFALIKFVNTNSSKWLIWGAVFFALAFLNKYSILFLIAGLFPALLLSEQRKIFVNKYFYIAIVLALLLIAPNIIWQYQNGFPVVHHMKELAETQLVNVKRSEFLFQQIVFFISSVFVLISALIGFFTYPPFKKFQFIFWSYLFVICIFTYLKAKGYYAIGLYPVLLAFGSVYIEALLQSGKKRYLRPVLVVLVVVIILPLIQVLFPILSPQQIEAKGKKFKSLGLLRWEDGKDHIIPQDFADMLGWRELAAKTEHLYDSLPDKNETLVITNNYGQAGAINYYTHNKLGAVSFNADYVNWFPTGKKIKNIIRIKTAKDTLNNEERHSFHTCTLIGKIEDPLSREYGTSIFLFAGADPSINAILKNKIAEAKNE